MHRDRLAALGIQLPVLPTIVLGGLPGPPDWAPRLERIGLDVVASGADQDTPETFAAAREAVPHRPLKAMGAVPGAVLAECHDDPPGGAYRVHPREVVVAVDGPDGLDDPNDIARQVLSAVANDPSAWWVAARGLREATRDVVEARLAALVEGVRHVRLYLAKRQFD
jgi:hypothetical protein